MFMTVKWAFEIQLEFAEKSRGKNFHASRRGHTIFCSLSSFAACVDVMLLFWCVLLIDDWSSSLLITDFFFLLENSVYAIGRACCHSLRCRQTLERQYEQPSLFVIVPSLFTIVIAAILFERIMCLYCGSFSACAKKRRSCNAKWIWDYWRLLQAFKQVHHNETDHRIDQIGRKECWNGFRMIITSRRQSVCDSLRELCLFCRHAREHEQ